jgi:hypothetical protein
MPIPCPRCVKGTWTDSNNMPRRCHYCQGTGQAQQTKTITELLETKPTDTVLQVKTDNLIRDGILPGDYLIVREQKTAEEGQLVVAMIDREARVRRHEPGLAVAGLVVAVLRTVA